MGSIDVRILRNSELLARAAAELLERCIRRQLGQAGHCVVALTGGGTPAETYRLLSRTTLPWTAISVFQTDERPCESEPKDRSATVIEENLIGPAGVPASNWYRMPIAPTIPLDEAAKEYGRRLLALRSSGAPDIALLGLGEDGHTASIFAGSAWAEAAATVAVTGPYRGQLRMTLTPAALLGCGARIMLASGATKRRAVADLLAGSDPSSPAAHILGRDGHLLLDEAAAGPGAGPPFAAGVIDGP
jgi:6-phosphogluconolactonase